MKMAFTFSFHPVSSKWPPLLRRRDARLAPSGMSRAELRNPDADQGHDDHVVTLKDGCFAALE